MLRNFLADRAGNFAMWLVIGAIPLLAVTAGALDYTTISSKRSHIQAALDAAALATAREFRSGKSEAELRQLAKDVFRGNYPPADETNFYYQGDIDRWGFVRVEVSASVPHSGLIGWDFWQADAQAVVTLSPQEPGCLLALHETASAAIHIGGSAQVHLNNCIMAANSSASSAISRIGSAQISAKCAFATGATNGLGSRTTLDCGAPVHGSPITPDPLLRIEPPAYTGCKGLPDGNPSVLEPGTYCGKTLTGDITLQPGNYILRGGQISLGGGGSLAGDGATIFLMDGAAMTLDGNQTISLKAPAAGDFQGIAIYQERGNSNQLTLTGASGSAITGFIYAPSAHIRYRGNSATSGDGECIRIVGSTIDLLGNSSIELDCESELGGRDIKAGDQHPRIVE